MPSTANGTPYSVISIDLGAPHGVMTITRADAVVGETLRCLVHIHGAGSTADFFSTAPAWTGLREALLDDTDNPWVIVEGIGGNTSGAQNWGNPEAVAAYLAYLDRAEQDYDINGVILLGRSMGGLVAANLYAHDAAGRFSGWINNSGVSTMGVGVLSGNRSDPTVRLAAATAFWFSPTVWTAWGADSNASMLAAAGAADAVPEEWTASVWAGKNILNCYGDADTSVPWETRGAQPLRDIWAGQPAIDQVSLRPGGDHSSGNGSYSDVDAMLTFIADVFGEDPPAREVYRATGMYLVGAAGERYAITPR